MNFEEKIAYVQKIYPSFSKKILYDVDKFGNDFCEMIMPNPNIENMPIALNVSEKGFIISVGQFENITGDKPIPMEAAIEAIGDVIDDKIVFALGYRDDEDVGIGKPFYKQIFALTGGDEDMSEEYEYFLNKISSKVSGFRRKLTKLKGKFIITSFSGSTSKTIFR